MLYAVKIQETLSRTVIVEAESFDEAKQKTNDAYKNSEIILDADDFDEEIFIESSTFGKNPVSANDERLNLFTRI